MQKAIYLGHLIWILILCDIVLNEFYLILINTIPVSCSGLRHHKSPFAVGEDQPGAHDRLLEDFFAESSAEADQDPRKVADTSPKRTNGGRG